jgi:phosphoenolpyruvate phosphomutase
MPTNKAAALRQLFSKPGMIRCAGAHNAAGARVAEIAGFEAIWSSSFEISASFCVPDSSVLSMAEYLQAARSMADSVLIPVVADCDTGYGNALNVAYAVKRFESAGVAGISIEDQTFPKTNSLIHGAQHLVSISEFRDKIRAAKDARVNPDFMIVARVEALIVGASQVEAQLRATEYADAGADAILIHWNQASPEPIERFLREWTHKVPIVVIPTTYYSISRRRLESLGAKMVIYANQGLRSALKAMEETFRAIVQDGNLVAVEQSLWPLGRVFEELQGVVDPGRSPSEDLQLTTSSKARTAASGR